jgi:hypothetical protein
LAQQAYRQRQEDAFTSLQGQVDNLHNTIEGLNSCFLALTDVLTTSEWLGKDTHVAGALKRSIETFLQLTGSSGDSHGSLNELTVDMPPEESLEVETFEDFTPHASPVGQMATHETARKLLAVKGRSPQEISSALRRTSLGSPIRFGESHINARVFNINSKILDGPPDVPSSFKPTQLNLTFFPTASWPPPKVDDLNFAKRLHRAAFQGGYRLARNAKQEYVDYQRVFKYTLNFHTNETLLTFLAKVVNENYDSYFEAPDANLPSVLGESKFRGWLNATEVAEYLSEKGFIFDGSQSYAELDMDVVSANTHVTDLPDSSGLPLLYFSPLAFLGNINARKPSPDLFRQPLSEPPKRRVIVDVTKLINGKKIRRYVSYIL